VITDDTPPQLLDLRFGSIAEAPSITLAVSPALVTEDGTANLVFTFTRTGSTTNALTVNYTVGGTATLGTDYTGISSTGATKTVTFAAGSATAVVTVDPIADTEVEPDETVELTLAAGNGYTIGTTATVSGTITNDDASSTDYSNDPLKPTLITGSGSTFNLSNTVGGADVADYVSFVVPDGSSLVSIQLTGYSSSDGRAFIALQKGAAFTATPVGGSLPGALGFTHFGSGVPDASVGSNLISKLGGTQTAGTYSLWIQQLGAQTDYTITLGLKPATVDIPSTPTGSRFTVDTTVAAEVIVNLPGSPDLIEIQAPVSATLNAISTETWTSRYVAYNAGSTTKAGTGERISLNGIGKYSFVAISIAAATTEIVLEQGKNTAFFLHDAYSAFYSGLPLTADSTGLLSAARLLDIDTIRMGSAGGTSIVDLTSKDYITGVVTVHGADQGRSVFWGTDADDTFISGGGDSLIYGGAGANRFTIGAGVDTLQYRSGVGAQDLISNFDPARDRLQFWLGRDEVTIEPTFDSTGSDTTVSWAGNTLTFLGLSNLSLDSLQISQHMALT